MNSLQALKNGSNLLREKNISTHIIDSELLLSKILNKTREEMLINLNEKIDEKNKFIFKKYLSRRTKKEPIAYILEEKEFWSKKFFVNKDTLIPRPETELLVDKLLKIYSGKKLSILDIRFRNIDKPGFDHRFGVCTLVFGFEYPYSLMSVSMHK